MILYISDKVKAQLKELLKRTKNFEFSHGDIIYTAVNGKITAWDIQNKRMCKIMNWKEL
jgi:hypothetical protein